MNDDAAPRRTASVLIDHEVLRIARQDAGLTQSELGELVGLSNRYISMIERGNRRTISPRAFRNFCDILRVRPTELRAFPSKVA